ncbi:penicillin-binding protein activator LpoB [Vitiosangium sp. GDMCC 1.1324]|uniref:penicillin-binding protein activator LpoB n=1 Tax=Vitiosangium sp. (strain GDMCC 1.1324) TaxID=2138576 RepID=UPI000D3D41E9|nr:penicillin-binding protein activator LpoB [Vitiosangium sp. GDMCC 1.1324]PTL78624.1 penicillin-binding protein activator LpoB [Vitiosangium sp. GDMCC 1.1324]
MKTRLIVSLSLAGLLAACGGRIFPRGSGEDPDTVEKVSGPFNENDLQHISKKMVLALANARRFAQPGQQLPVVRVGPLKNKTPEPIDMVSLGDTIQTGLAQTGRFAPLDTAPGEQASADYVLTGELSSFVHRAGNDQLVYYKLTAKLNNVRTGTVEWTVEREIRKKFEQMPVTW